VFRRRIDAGLDGIHQFVQVHVPRNDFVKELAMPMIGRSISNP